MLVHIQRPGIYVHNETTAATTINTGMAFCTLNLSSFTNYYEDDDADDEEEKEIACMQ